MHFSSHKTPQKTNVEDEFLSGQSGEEDQCESDVYEDTKKDGPSFFREINARKRYLPPETSSSRSSIYSFMDKSSTKEKKEKRQDATKDTRGKRYNPMSIICISQSTKCIN